MPRKTIAVFTGAGISAEPHRAFFRVQWVAPGWGIALLSHALNAFDLIPFFGAEWEKKQAEKRLGRSL